MKRKMVAIGFAYISGLYLSSVLPYRVFAAVCIIAAAVLIFCLLFHKIKIAVSVIVTVSFLFGACLYFAETANSYTPVMALAGKSTTFTGQVTEINIYKNDFSVYTLDGSFCSGENAKVSCLTENLGCRYGDMVTVSGTFEPVKNNYAYDSARYNKGKSIFLTTTYDCRFTLNRRDGFELVRKLSDYRNRIRLRLYALGGQYGGSLSTAMIFGDTSGLSDRVSEAFEQTGLAPMLSVSGFHLVIISSLCNVIGNKTRLQRILNFCAVAVLTVLFSVTAMFPVSIMRAGLMLLISRAACIFYREGDSLSGLCISVIILTVNEPYLIHNASFLLSVAGTFGISTFAPWMCSKFEFRGIVGLIVKPALYSAFTTLCTLPICICYFDETSLLAPVSNVVFTPLCVVIIISGIIVFFTGGVSGVAHICGAVNKTAGKLLAEGLMWMEENIPLSIPCGWEAAHITAGAAAVIVIAVYFIRKRRRDVCIASAFAVLMTCGSVYVSRNNMDNRFMIHILGRNQDLAAVVTYKGKTDVFDLTADNKNAQYVKSFFTRHGIKDAETLYIADSIPSASALYDSMFYDINVHCVLAGSPVDVIGDDTICGCVPQGMDSCIIDRGEYKITVNKDMITVNVYNKDIVIAYVNSKEDEFLGHYIVRSSYMQHGKTLTVKDGNVRPLNENTSIYVDKDGSISVDSLS